MAPSSRSYAARRATLAAGAVKTVLVDARDERESERVTDYLKELGFGIAAKFNGADGAPGFHAVFARDATSVGEAMANCEIPESASTMSGREQDDDVELSRRGAA